MRAQKTITLTTTWFSRSLALGFQRQNCFSLWTLSSSSSSQPLGWFWLWLLIIVTTAGLENVYQEILSHWMAVPNGVFSCLDNNTIVVALGASFAPIRVDYCQCQHSSCKNPSNVLDGFQQKRDGGRSWRTEREREKMSRPSSCLPTELEDFLRGGQGSNMFFLSYQFTK